MQRVPLQAQTRRSRLFIATALGVAGSFAVFQLWRRVGDKDGPEGVSTVGSPPPVFIVPEAMNSHLLLSKPTAVYSGITVDQALRAREQTYDLRRTSNPVYRYDTNSVGGNSLNEDEFASVIVGNVGSSALTDAAFFGVFDGHGGWQASRFLSRHLIGRVTRELRDIFEGPASVSQPIERLLMQSDASLDELVHAAMKRAFIKTDDGLIDPITRVLNELRTSGDVRLPVSARVHHMDLLYRAISGSCAILAYLDIARNRLHVANTGDCRAVMGTWEEPGCWRVSVLSEDHGCNNPAELKRMQAEHPPGEAADVCKNGRVIGGQVPTRAFGDARFKWARKEGADATKLIAGNEWPASALLKTPPYVTALPEVKSVSLRSSAMRAQGQCGMFLVLATDGLFDCLSNDEVVGLVGGWLDGIKGSHTRSAVLSAVKSADPTDPPHQPGRARPIPKDSGFVFDDDNLATHLIRNALGGTAKDYAGALLSCPIRGWRDDITAVVILLGDPPRTADDTESASHRTTDAARKH